MVDSVDVAVIGGGILGTSAAFQLSQHTKMNVALFEKGSLAAGSSGRSAGVVRHCYATEFMVRSALESRKIWENFEREVGESIQYAKNSEVILEPEENSKLALDRVKLMRKVGLEVKVYDQDELGKRFPFINPEGVSLAIVDEEAGYVADPVEPVCVYARQATKLGCRIYENTRVKEIKVERGSVRSIITERGEIRARYVVNAAGPWASRVGRMVGIDIPVEAERQQVIDLEPKKLWPRNRPTISDRLQIIYARPTMEGFVHCGAHYLGEKCDPDDFRKGVDMDFVFSAATRLVYRIPGLRDASIAKGSSGLYENTPDMYPILCHSKEVDGFIIAAGFSGHGYKHGPIFGRLIRELIQEGRTSLDIHLLRLERFKTGELVEVPQKVKAPYG